MSLIQVNNLTYDYVLRSGTTHALRGINVEFEEGKLYAITGRSGSGKTTLLSLLAAFDDPKSGSIFYDGKDVQTLRLTDYRFESVGVIFQSYNLIPHLTALENVRLPLDMKTKLKKNVRNQIATDALYSVGLREEHFKKMPLTLSGGEQQRVAIARTLASGPKVLLADEPTGNLDNENSRNIIDLLKKLAHVEGKCVILVTHATEIAEEADVEYRMSDGVCVDKIVRR